MTIDTSPAEMLAERSEGFSSEPYLCPAKVPTIGLGSTYYEDGSRVTLSDPPITIERARELLKHEMLVKYLPAVIRLCPPLLHKALNENDIWKLNAILDFCYNLGAGNLQCSTLRRVINDCRWADVPEQLLKWNKGGGRVLRGLTQRRQAEVLMGKW
jgi:lysozyme